MEKHPVPVFLDRTTVKSRLIELRLKQFEAAQQLGLSDSRMSVIVSGRLAVLPGLAERLARILDLPVSAIVSRASAATRTTSGDRAPVGARRHQRRHASPGS